MANLTKDEEKERNKCITELNRIEKKYGKRIFRTACNRKITVDRQMEQQRKDILKGYI